jgi:hypothetical protein
MSLTLAITDDAATPTGIVATISGSSGGPVLVFTRNVDGQLTAGTWTNSGSRAGDGTISIPLTKGYYFAYVQDGATMSPPAYFQVTDGLTSVLGRCVAAVKSTLQLLNLPCTQRVYDSLHANSPLVQYPCTLLATEGSSQTEESALNGRDDLGQPVRVLVKDVCLKFDDSNRETYRQWRQAITRCFINQRLAGVPESVRNKVELGEVAIVESRAPQVVLEITVRAVTREVRGVGA